jgi:hypothetical protein
VVTPVFAPVGREIASLMTSASLIVFAAGTVGYAKVKLSGLKKFAAEK